MSRIFISYRRDDSGGYAGRLFDRLERQFGKSNIFMDIDSLSPGVDFVDVLNSKVSSCDVLLAVIGRNWLAVTDDEGRIRLDNPEDFVRLEITAALDRNICVIPVLVGGATMPRSAQLPSPLARLARRQASAIPDVGFHGAVDRLIVAIEEAVTQRTEQERIDHEQAEAAAKKAEQDRIDREQAEAAAKKAEQDRIVREQAEAGAEKAEQDRIDREQAEAAAKKAEQERIDREQAEAAANKAEQERREAAQTPERMHAAPIGTLMRLLSWRMSTSRVNPALARRGSTITVFFGLFAAAGFLVDLPLVTSLEVAQNRVILLLFLSLFLVVGLLVEKAVNHGLDRIRFTPRRSRILSLCATGGILFATGVLVCRVGYDVQNYPISWVGTIQRTCQLTGLVSHVDATSFLSTIRGLVETDPYGLRNFDAAALAYFAAASLILAAISFIVYGLLRILLLWNLTGLLISWLPFLLTYPTFSARSGTSATVYWVTGLLASLLSWTISALSLLFLAHLEQ